VIQGGVIRMFKYANMQMLDFVHLLDKSEVAG
jgi:hypothetical protein